MVEPFITEYLTRRSKSSRLAWRRFQSARLRSTFGTDSVLFGSVIYLAFNINVHNLEFTQCYACSYWQHHIKHVIYIDIHCITYFGDWSSNVAILPCCVQSDVVRQSSWPADNDCPQGVLHDVQHWQAMARGPDFRDWRLQKRWLRFTPTVCSLR